MCVAVSKLVPPDSVNKGAAADGGSEVAQGTGRHGKVKPFDSDAPCKLEYS